MNKINIGIIGCGYWGPNFIRNFTAIPGVSLKYACDLSQAHLASIKKSYPAILTTRNYKTLLSDKDINAVVIATSANTHYQLAKDALLSGKDVLVEKPIATRLSHAQELIKIASASKRVLMVGHTFKYNSGIRELRRLIKTKMLGNIFYIYSIRTNLGPLRRDVNAVWDLAPHDISIANFLLMSEPISLSAQGVKYLAHDLEDVSFITLKYPHKVLVHIHVSWLDPKKTREIVVVGNKKMAVFNDLIAGAPINIYDKSVVKKSFKQQYGSFREFQMIIKSGDVQTPKIDSLEPLKEECRHFIDCVRYRKIPLSDGIDGLNVLKVLIAIDKSLRNNGKEVRIL